MTEQNPVSVTYPGGRVPNVPSAPASYPTEAMAPPAEHIIDGHLPPGSGAGQAPTKAVVNTFNLGTALGIARVLIEDGHMQNVTLEQLWTVLDKIAGLL